MSDGSFVRRHEDSVKYGIPDVFSLPNVYERNVAARFRAKVVFSRFLPLRGAAERPLRFCKPCLQNTVERTIKKDDVSFSAPNPHHSSLRNGAPSEVFSVEAFWVSLPRV